MTSARLTFRGVPDVEEEAAKCQRHDGLQHEPPDEQLRGAQDVARVAVDQRRRLRGEARREVDRLAGERHVALELRQAAPVHGLVLGLLQSHDSSFEGLVAPEDYH